MTNETPEKDIKRPTSKPKKALPAGAWDCHTHVFGPYDRYPLLKERTYEPPLATCNDYINMLTAVGFEHGVIVHAGAAGWDNMSTADATRDNWPKFRAVGVLAAETSIEELKRYHDMGMRGMRVSILPHHALGGPGVLGKDHLDTLIPKFQELGWHINLWATPDVTIDLPNRLKQSKVPVILDHMGFYKVDAGVKAPEFQNLLSVIADNNYYVKLTVNRISNNFPGFEEVRPFYEAFAERVPDQLVFGSDWPYIVQGSFMPDVGKMVDLFDAWVPDETIRQKVFVTNPANFYGS